MSEKIAPFRADHVGSLLRPPELLSAREQHQGGTLSSASLREIEDRCIRDVAKLQEEIGLQGITDGEYRRTIWHADFLRQIEGVSVEFQKWDSVGTLNRSSRITPVPTVRSANGCCRFLLPVLLRASVFRIFI